MKNSAILIILGGLFICCAPGALAKGDPAKGKEIYQENCVPCHGNPALGIPSGDYPSPAVTGSSRELLEFRVLRAAYPPGYKPKNPTKEMPPFPALEPRIDDLFAFLNQ